MAGTVITSAQVSIGAVDLTDYVQSVEISESYDELDTTNMGSSGRRERVAGLGDAQITINFFQDYGSSSVNDTIGPLVGTSAAFLIVPASGGVSATNPSYAGNVLIKEWSPITGTVGEVSMVSVTWSVDGVITKATA